jgi:hypothetical protein
MSSAALADNAIVSRKPTLIAADVADEAILLDVDSGYFFQLNKTAARIWGLVEQPLPVAELCGEMGKAFAVDPAECRSDVIAFVADMRDRGLLVVS